MKGNRIREGEEDKGDKMLKDIGETSEIELTLCPLPNLDFVHGYPEYRLGCRIDRRLWLRALVHRTPIPRKVESVRIELRKTETLPGGGLSDTFHDFVGLSLVSKEKGQKRSLLSRHVLPFSINIPESIPPSITLENGAGIKYDLVASICTRDERSFFRKRNSYIMSTMAPVIIKKHELHSTWPLYSQPEWRAVTEEGVTLTVERKQTCYGPGDSITVNATLKSTKSLHMVILTGFEMSLRESTIFRAGPYTAVPPERVAIVAENKFSVNATLYGEMHRKLELGCMALMGTGKHLEIELPVVMSNWQRGVSVEAVKRIGPVPSLSLTPNSPNPTTSIDRTAPRFDDPIERLVSQIVANSLYSASGPDWNEAPPPSFEQAVGITSPGAAFHSGVGLSVDAGSDITRKYKMLDNQGNAEGSGESLAVQEIVQPISIISSSSDSFALFNATTLVELQLQGVKQETLFSEHHDNMELISPKEDRSNRYESSNTGGKDATMWKEQSTLETFLVGAVAALDHITPRMSMIRALMHSAGMTEDQFCIRPGFNEDLIMRGAGMLQQIFVLLSTESTLSDDMISELGEIFSPFPGVICTPTMVIQTPVFHEDGREWDFDDLVLNRLERINGQSSSNQASGSNSNTAGDDRHSAQGQGNGSSGGKDHSRNSKNDGEGARGDDDDPEPGVPQVPEKGEAARVYFSVTTDIHFGPPVQIQRPEPKKTIGSVWQRFVSQSTPHLAQPSSSFLPASAAENAKEDIKSIVSTSVQTLKSEGFLVTTHQNHYTSAVQFQYLRFQTKSHSGSSKSAYHQYFAHVTVDSVSGNSVLISKRKPDSTSAADQTIKETVGHEIAWTGTLTANLKGLFGAPTVEFGATGSRAQKDGSTSERIRHTSRIKQEEFNGHSTWRFWIDDPHVQENGIKFNPENLPSVEFERLAYKRREPLPDTVLVEVASYWRIPSPTSFQSALPAFHNICQLVSMKLPSNLTQHQEYVATLQKRSGPMGERKTVDVNSAEADTGLHAMNSQSLDLERMKLPLVIGPRVVPEMLEPAPPIPLPFNAPEPTTTTAGSRSQQGVESELLNKGKGKGKAVDQSN
ncbi:hypothetical protein C8J56DRAFT_1117467 [Mycena floridula]|nr:hypothetical protein C8J56DRAFT_1117467 [Mycena floridula]